MTAKKNTPSFFKVLYPTCAPFKCKVTKTVRAFSTTTIQSPYALKKTTRKKKKKKKKTARKKNGSPMAQGELEKATPVKFVVKLMKTSQGITSNMALKGAMSEEKLTSRTI